MLSHMAVPQSLCRGICSVRTANCQQPCCTRTANSSDRHSITHQLPCRATSNRLAPQHDNEWCTDVVSILCSTHADTAMTVCAHL